MTPARRLCGALAALGLSLPGTVSCGHAPAEAVAAFPPFTVRGRWSRPKDLSVRVAAEGEAVLLEALRSAVDEAVSAWNVTGSIQLVRVGDEGRGTASSAVDITVCWAGSDGGPTSSGTDTSIAWTGPVGPGCTVELDPRHEWGGPPGKTALRSAVLHELGHALGLDHIEDGSSVMHPQWSGMSPAVGPGDRAGLESLYGGGRDSDGDLAIERVGADPLAGRLASLRGLGLLSERGWLVFDTDGDGAEEVMVWSTDRRAMGAWMAYHFDPGPVLSKTVGPVLGVTHVGPLRFTRDPAGRPCIEFEVRGVRTRRLFDPSGVPGAAFPVPAGEPAAGEPGALRALHSSDANARERSGDLDGDGNVEHLRVIAH